MIEAEKLLLNAALEDPANQRFILLSDRLVSLPIRTNTFTNDIYTYFPCFEASRCLRILHVM